MELKFHIQSIVKSSEIFVFERIFNSELETIKKPEFQSKTIDGFLAHVKPEQNLILKHDARGAPYLDSSEALFISISHSKNWYAVQMSKKDKVGIDIQVIDRSLFPGRSYFINEKEEAKLELTQENLYLIWCAKEAVYKLKRGDVSDYKNDICIEKIGEESMLIDLSGEKINCSFKIENGFILVFVN